MYRTYFFRIFTVWFFLISSFSPGRAMDLADDDSVSVSLDSPRSALHKDSKALQRETIDKALQYVSSHHGDLIKKEVAYKTAWISKKTTQYDQGAKTFLDALDDAFLYPRGILTTREKWLDYGFKLWWGSIDGASVCAILPVVLVFGGVVLNIIPDDSMIVFLPMSLLIPGCMNQGVKFADSIRQSADPRGLTSTTLEAQEPQTLKIMDLKETEELMRTANIQQIVRGDDKPHLLPHKDLNFHRMLSLAYAGLANWPYILFFWYIERYTEDTRLWRSYFLPSYTFHLIKKDYDYHMNYFKKENIKEEQKKFIDTLNIKKKKILKDRLRILRHLINGPESDDFVNALHQVLEERRNNRELFIKVCDVMTRNDTNNIDDINQKNQIIQQVHQAIFVYIKKSLPTFNNRWTTPLQSNIDDFLNANLTYYSKNNSNFFPKLYNYVKRQALYLKVQNTLEHTLQKKPHTWNEELAETTYQFLNETKDLKKDTKVTKEVALEKRLEYLKRIIIGSDIDKENAFLDALNQKSFLKDKETCADELTESAMSLFFLYPKRKLSFRDSNRVGSRIKEDRDFIEALQFVSPKSTAKKTLEEISKACLCFYVLPRFICSMWTAKIALDLRGSDSTASFITSLSIATADGVLNVVRNWYPQQQEFSELRNLTSQKDFRYLRLGGKVIFGGFPAIFCSVVIPGILWTALGGSTDFWLICLLIMQAMPTEVMSQFNFFGTAVDEIVTETVTQSPMPSCLQTAQNRSILNKDLNIVQKVVENLNEASTDRLYNFVSTSSIKQNK